MIVCNNIFCKYHTDTGCSKSEVSLDFEGKCKLFSLPYDDTFGGRLEKLITDSGLTGRDIANSLKVSEALVSMWRTNERAPKLRQVVDLCKYLDVSADYLLLGRGNMYYEEEE